MLCEKINSVHVITKAFHDGSVRSDIKEQVNRGLQNAANDVIMYLFHGFVNHDPHDALLDAPEQGLEGNE